MNHSTSPASLAALGTVALAWPLALPAHRRQGRRRSPSRRTFTTTDPYDANDTLSQAMAKSFYEGLYGFDKDMKMVPVLAESYTVSKDGLVYTIKLRKGIKFHDGTDFKADAVKANLRPRDQSRQQAQALRPLQHTSPRPRSSTTTRRASR